LRFRDHTQSHHTWQDFSGRGIGTSQHRTLTSNRHDPSGIRSRNPSKPETADPCLRPRGHQVNKPRNIRWARHAAQKTSAYVIIVAKPEGKKPLGKLGISGRSILCLGLKKQDGSELGASSKPYGTTGNEIMGVPVFIDNGRFSFECFQFMSQLILQCLYWHYTSSEPNS